MRTLVPTVLAGLLGFAVGSWPRSRPAPAPEPALVRPAKLSPSDTASARSPASTDANTVTPPGETKSLRERLKELARSRNPLAAAAEAQALIAKLTAEDFRELAAQP